MKKLLVIPVLLLLVAGLGAQGKTATEFGVIAKTGLNVDSVSVVKGTKTPVSAFAETNTAYARSYGYHYRNGLYVYERAYATTKVSTTCAAGTTTVKGGKLGDPHALEINIPADKGTNGFLVLSWYLYKPVATGVTVKFVVNAEGKDVYTFTEANVTTTVSVPVTAGATGVNLKITTSGVATVNAKGYAYYFASLRALFEPTPITKATFTTFGKGCGLTLTGSVKGIYGTTKYDLVELKITGAAKGSIPILLVGSPRTTSIPLPAGNCPLWVDPLNAISVNQYHFKHYIYLRPQTGYTRHYQAATIEFSSAGLAIKTSNGLTMKLP